MLQYTSYKKAFSLAEAITFLLVSCLIMLATMPLITRKHMKIPERQPHGKWACKLINGEMYSASSASLNAPLENWKKGCDFPVLPDSVSYIRVSVIGGGAAGQKGVFDISSSSETKELFPKDENGEEYEVQSTGDYELFLTGSKGTKGTLSPSTYDIILRGFKHATCVYDEANADDQVASVKFKTRLIRGDKLVLNKDFSDIALAFNGSYPNLCPDGSTTQVEWINGNGSKITDTYTFGTFKINNGKNGPTNEFTLYRKDNKYPLIKIKGSGGGYYDSAGDFCSLDCSKRYVPLKDRTSYKLNDYFDKNILTSYKDYTDELVSAKKKSTITSLGTQVEAHGGCGGAAGQVQTIIIEKPDEAVSIDIGRGGIASASTQTDDSNSQINGGDTKFGSVVAMGGQGCFVNTAEDSFHGAVGESANTLSEKDSKGGSGGEGVEFKGILQKDLHKLNGSNSEGFGSGGGGGAIGISLNKTLYENYLNNKKFEEITKRIKYGTAGNGASGGVVVSW